MKRFAVLLTCLLTLVLQDNLLPASILHAQNTVTVKIDRTVPDGTSRLAVGATHAKESLDRWGNLAAVARGKDLLRQASVYQSQHIVGFGAENPWPDPRITDPNKWNWQSLDQRVQLMRDTGAISTITLCCAPTWMVDPNWTGGTDYSKLYWAPLPEHEDNFARLAREVARRYPDVKYYFVWNEMKGFWNPKIDSWDYERYTRLYNKVYDAVKGVNPANKVGGPYLVLKGTGSLRDTSMHTARPIIEQDRIFLEYWRDHKRGADFWAIDRKIRTLHDKNVYTEAELLALTPFFADVTRQLRAIQDMPVWFVESGLPKPDDNQQYVAVGLASMLYHQLKAGAAVSMRWAPQRQPSNDNYNQNLFTDTLVAGGGQPLPSFYVYKTFREHFGPGTQLYRATSSSPNLLEVLASATKTLLINKQSAPIAVVVNGASVTLNPYEVRVVDVALPIGAPTSLIATATSSSRIDLKWADNAPSESGYKIERSTNGTTFTQIAKVGANITTYASTGLQTNTLYYYRVRAYTDQRHSAFSNTAQAKTLLK